MQQHDENTLGLLNAQPSPAKGRDLARKPAPLWYGELAHSIHPLSPRKALSCFLPRVAPDDGVSVFFLPDAESVPTVQKEHGLESMVWTTVAAMRNGEGPLYFSYRLGPQTITAQLGSKAAKISHYQPTQRNAARDGQLRHVVKPKNPEYHAARIASTHLAAKVHTINNELTRLVRDQSRVDAAASSHTAVVVTDRGIAITMGTRSAQLELNVTLGRLELHTGTAMPVVVESLTDALQQMAGGALEQPVVVRFEGHRMAHLDALQRPGEPAEVFFLRVAQPEQLEEGLARLAGAALQQDALPALLTHGAVQVLVSTALCIPPTLTAHLLSTADALLHNNPTHVLHLLVQELCTQLACMETHPPALYSLVHAVAGHAGHGADEHLEQLATALARHFGRVFVGTAAKDALRQTLTPAGSAASTPTRAGRGASSHSASATPQRLQMAINRAALRSHPVGDESPASSPARPDRPTSRDTSRSTSPTGKPQAPQSGPPTRLVVPRLSLPLSASQRPLSAGMHRSTRRSVHSHRNSPSLVARLSSTLGRSPSQRDVTAASPSAELTALAQSLAQSIIAQDLTALIRAKREAQGGSRTNSPTACDAAGPGAQGALFSGASTPMVGGTPRGGIVHTGAMQAVIGSPHIEPEDSVADPRRCVAQLHVQGGPADLARRVCVLDSLRRLLQGRGGGLLDAGTRQDTLLWLTHEALSGGGVAVAAGGDLWVLPSVKSNPGAVAQAAHRHACLQLLQLLACAPVDSYTHTRLDDHETEVGHLQSTRWATAERTFSVLISAACQRLASVLSTNSNTNPHRTEDASRILLLLHDVVLTCAHPSVPRLVLDGCWQSIQLIKATLFDTLPAKEWTPPHMQLLQGTLYLLIALLHAATEGPSAQRLLSLLFEDADMAAVWVGYAGRLFQAGGATEGPSKHKEQNKERVGGSTPRVGEGEAHGGVHANQVTAAQEQLLHMVLAALRLSTRLRDPFGPPAAPTSPWSRASQRGASGATPNGGACRRLSMPAVNGAAATENSPSRHASFCASSTSTAHASTPPTTTPAGDHPLAVLWPLMDPRMGILLHALQLPQQHNVQRLALATLMAAFEAPGNPFVVDKCTVDFYLQYHFMQFATRYHAHTPSTPHQRALLRGHLAVLCAIAKTKTQVVKRRFYQLCVMELCVHELSLECQLGCGVVATVAPTAWKQAAEVAEGGVARSSSGMDGLSARSQGSRDGGTPRSARASLPPSLRGATPQRSESSNSLRRASTNSPTTGSPVPPLRLGPLPPVPQWQQEPTRNTPPPLSARGSARGSSRFAKEHAVRSARGSADSSGIVGTVGLSGGGLPSARKAGVPSPTAELAGPLGLPSTRPDSARRQSLQMPARLQHINRVHPAPPPDGGPAEPCPPTGSAMPIMPAALRMPAGTQGGGAPTQGEGAVTATSSSPSWGSSLRLGLGGLLGSRQGSDEGVPLVDGGQSTKGEGGASSHMFTGDLEEDVERMLEEEERAERAARKAAGIRSVGRDLDTDSESGSEGWAHDDDDEDAMSDQHNTPPTKGPAIPRLTFDIAATAGVVTPAVQVRPPALAVPRLAFGSPGLAPAGSPAAEASPGPPGPGALLTALEQAVVGKGKMQLATLAGSGALRGVGGGMAGPPLSYEEERAAREVYRDPQLHLLILQLVLELSLTEMGGLDTRYYDQLPLDRHLPNIAYVLAAHLNHPANATIVPPLYSVAQRMGHGAVPLLKLLVRGLFHKQLYGSRQRVARGAFAQVFRTQLASLSGTVALKAIDMPTSVHDRCAQFDLHGEVTILEALARCEGVPSPRAGFVCRLFDYGCDTEGLYLVLKDYRCSLKDWRNRHARGCTRDTLPLYLAVFQQALQATASLAAANVVHYDIKADNLLIQPHAHVGEDALWMPHTPRPPFDLVLADFGESRRFHPDEEPITGRNRGTECVKSPEMLQVANANKKARANFDRRRKEGAGPSSDVWSLGCLLYELVIGDFLYHDPDWIRFFFRVTRANEALLPPEKAAALQGLPEVGALLEYILVRDPLRRPTVGDVIKRVEAVEHQLSSSVRYTPPHPNADAPTTSSRSTGSTHSGPPGTARLLQDTSALGVCTRQHFARHLVPVLWTGGGAGGSVHPATHPAVGGEGRTVATYIAGLAGAVDAQVLLRHGVTHAVLLYSPADAAGGEDTSGHGASTTSSGVMYGSIGGGGQHTTTIHMPSTTQTNPLGPTSVSHSTTHGNTPLTTQTAAACARAFVDLRVLHVDGVLASDAPQQGLCAQRVAQHLAAVHTGDPGACSVVLYEGPAAQAAAEMAVLLRLQATSGISVFEALTSMLRARPFTVLQV